MLQKTVGIILVLILAEGFSLGNPAVSWAKEPKKEEPAKEKPAGKGASRIQAGDRILIKIYPEDEYIKGGENQVSSEGEIALSLLGKIKIQGMTLSEAEQKLAELLSKDYLVNPVVVIEFVKRSFEEKKPSVSVLGQVQKPGSYDINPDQKFTVLKVLSMAGGFTDIANPKRIKVVRKEGGKNRVIRANAEAIISGKAQDVELEPGDVVHVGESFF